MSNKMLKLSDEELDLVVGGAWGYLRNVEDPQTGAHYTVLYFTPDYRDVFLNWLNEHYQGLVLIAEANWLDFPEEEGEAFAVMNTLVPGNPRVLLTNRDIRNIADDVFGEHGTNFVLSEEFV